MKTFGAVRLQALEQWFSGTGRTRDGYSDDISGAYECGWQNGFKDPDPECESHYSIFCSVGEWNTNITDWLMDDRFDNFTMDNDEQKDRLFRHFTNFFLLVSEILTDFQDMLNNFRLGRFPQDFKEAKKENKISRDQLDYPGMKGTIQKVFSYVNSVFKHKTYHLHVCNHHLHIFLDDSDEKYDEQDALTLDNAEATMERYIENRALVSPNKVVIPPLALIMAILIHCYQVADKYFHSDSRQFEIFRDLYKGLSQRPMA